MESVGINLSASSTEVMTDTPNHYGISTIVNSGGNLRIQTLITAPNFATKFPVASKVIIGGTFSNVAVISYNGSQTVSASTAGGQIDTDVSYTAAATNIGTIGKKDATVVGLI